MSDSGDSFDIAMEHLQEKGRPETVRSAALHHKAVSTYAPDYYSELVEEWHWIIYPWAIIEDLQGILHQMTAAPATVDDFASYLLEQHQLVVPRQTLEDVIAISKNT